MTQPLREKMAAILSRLYNGPGLCIFLSLIFGFITLILLRSLASALFEMHRSRTAEKKLRKEYSFGEKFLLILHWDHCIHAPNFCKTLICIHHIRISFLLIHLLLSLCGLWIPELQKICVWGFLLCLLLIDIPIGIIETVLDRYPLRRRNHEYRFKAYDHTSERKKLL